MIYMTYIRKPLIIFVLQFSVIMISHVFLFYMATFFILNIYYVSVILQFINLQYNFLCYYAFISVFGHSLFITINVMFKSIWNR